MQNAFDQIQHISMIKALNRLGTDRPQFYIIKATKENPQLTSYSTTITKKKLKAFPLGSGTRRGCPLSPHLLRVIMDGLPGWINQARKEIKGI